LRSLPDQREYLECAVNLLETGELKFFDPDFGEEVYAFRMPGYPAFIAALGANLRAVRVAQAIIDTSTVLAAFMLARRWLSPRRAVFAAAVVAFNPFLVYFSALILTETVFTAMLAWGMVLMVRGTLWPFIAGAMLLALSPLVRPSAIPLPAIMGLAVAWLNMIGGGTYPPVGNWEQRRAGSPARRLGVRVVVAGLACATLTLAVLLPWAWRNSRVVGHWIWTTTNSGITAYDGLNPQATGASDQAHIRRMPKLQWMDEVERSRYLGRLANEFARENPRRATELAAFKIARTWSPIPLSAEFGGRRLYVAVAILYAAPFYLLVLAGLLRGRLPRSAKLLLLVPAIYFTIIHAASVGSLRYRIPAEVPMAVVAACVGRYGWRHSS